MLKNIRSLFIAAISFFCILAATPAFANKTASFQLLIHNGTGKTVECLIPQQPSSVLIKPNQLKTVVLNVKLKKKLFPCVHNSSCQFSFFGTLEEGNGGDISLNIPNDEEYKTYDRLVSNFEETLTLPGQCKFIK